MTKAMDAPATSVREPLWSVRFVFIAIIHMFVTLTFLLLMSSVAAYAMERFHVGEAAAGFAAGVFVFGALVARLFAGKFIDFVGRKRMLTIALVIMAIAGTASFLADAFWLLVLARFVQGAMVGVSTTVTNTVAMDLIPLSRRGEGTGWFTLSVTMSHALGPFLGIWLHQVTGGFEAVFIAGVVPSIVGLVLALVIKVDEVVLTKDDRAELRQWRLNQTFEPGAIKISIVILFVAIGYIGVMSFMGPFSQEIQLESWAAWFFLVYAFTLMVSRPLVGRIYDIRGANTVVIPSLVSYAGGMVLLGLSTQGWMMLVAAVLISLGYGNLISVGQAIAVKKSDPKRTGIAVSTYYIFLDLGAAASPLLLGLIAPLTGYALMFALVGAALLLLIVLYWVLIGRAEGARSIAFARSSP